MNSKLVTKEGKVFIDPKEIPEEIIFGIAWVNEPFSRDHEVISAFPGWEIVGEDQLRDSRGELRLVGWGKYHEAIEFPSWREFDRAQIEKELKEAKNSYKDVSAREAKEKELNKMLLDVLEEVYYINEKAGPGSRKKVKELLQGLFTL